MRKTPSSTLYSRIESAGYGTSIGKTAADDADYLRHAHDIPGSPEKTKKLDEIARRMEAFVRRHPGDSITRDDVAAVRRMR